MIVENTDNYTYSEISNDVKVEVKPMLLRERSRPEKGFFFYIYTVKITNLSDDALSLEKRHWIIRDGQGREEHVKGEGVVGESPTINPGNTFEYTSACPLRTPTGNMRGNYLMKSTEGKTLEIKIPLFFLRPPHTLQ